MKHSYSHETLRVNFIHVYCVVSAVHSLHTKQKAAGNPKSRGTKGGGIYLYIRSRQKRSLSFNIWTEAATEKTGCWESYHFYNFSVYQAWDVRRQGYTQIRPVLVGDLGTRLKNSKFWWFRLENRHFVLLSTAAKIGKHFKRCRWRQ